MKKFVRSSSMVAMAATAILMCSCSKNFGFYDPAQNVADEYAKGWQEAFGDIDSNQDWNLATQRAVTVTVAEQSEVNIYTKGLDKSYLLARSIVTGTMEIKFDARKDLAEVYVVAIAGDKRDVRTVNISGESAIADFTASSSARAAMRAGETLPNRELVYALGYNFKSGMFTNHFNNDYANIINVGSYDGNYNYLNWGSQMYATVHWNSTLQETGTDCNMETFADVKEGCSNLYTANDDDITKLYPFTQNYKMVTAKAQEITLTGIFRNTAGSTALIYYYTAPDATTEQLKAADKYVLIPNTKNIVGKEYKLVYYDPENNYAPSYTFPANIEIHFALAINPSCYSAGVDWTNETGDINVNAMLGALISFSDEALNTEMFQNAQAAGKYGAWTSMASSAVYTYNGVNIISFEDWGGQFTVNNGVPSVSGNNSIDWNDIAFAINADFQTPPPPVEEEQEEGESWIIACEDLGDTDDYDFNDVVFKVTHVSGQTTATVTPLAAGGVLETWITHSSSNEYIGETHQLLGAQASSTGNYPMINTSKITATGTPKTVNVGADFSITKNMGGFGIIVKAKSGDTNATVITAPTTGAAPQMICVPDSWAWPTERTKVQDAYPDFANWSANSNNIEWYKNANASVVIGGSAE